MWEKNPSSYRAKPRDNRRIGELVARNAALIARLRRYEATDQALIAAGRRYRPGPPEQENPDPRQDRLELAEPPE